MYRIVHRTFYSGAFDLVKARKQRKKKYCVKQVKEPFLVVVYWYLYL